LPSDRYREEDRNPSMKFINVILFIVVFSTPAYAFDPGQIISDAIRSYDQVIDYTCLFYKKELVKDQYIEQKNIILKHRKPRSFYLKWTEGDGKGTEVIYVEGKNDNKLTAHAGGFLKWITVKVDPCGSIAMKNNRHTVLEAHLGNFIEICDKNYKLAKQLRVGTFEMTGEEMIDGRATICIKATFPDDRRFYGKIIYIYVDREYKFPVAVEIYGWNNELIEKYEYNNIKLNVGLTDKDFDSKNEEYEFYRAPNGP
jgi:outer membrane lipoprotein-sorting protein